MEQPISVGIPTEIFGPPPEVIPNIRSEETETNLSIWILTEISGGSPESLA